MDPDFYRVLHYLGIFALMIGLGVVAGVGANPEKKGLRVVGSIVHGLGAVIALVAGVGMVHKLGGENSTVANPELYSFSKGWVLAKLGIWLLLGIAIMAFRRVPGLTMIWILASVALGGLSGWIAIAKPF